MTATMATWNIDEKYQLENLFEKSDNCVRF
jgi:hypothetical protein